MKTTPAGHAKAENRLDQCRFQIILAQRECHIAKPYRVGTNQAFPANRDIATRHRPAVRQTAIGWKHPGRATMASPSAIRARWRPCFLRPRQAQGDPWLVPRASRHYPMGSCPLNCSRADIEITDMIRLHAFKDRAGGWQRLTRGGPIPCTLAHSPRNLTRPKRKSRFMKSN
jgi:hypothetical protein